MVGGSPAGALRAWRRDAVRHPSPNAGVVEAAFAGALGVRLGGPTQYAHELEIRPTLGDGPAPQISDLASGGAAVAGRAAGQRGVGGGASAPLAVAVGEFLLGGERRGRRPALAAAAFSRRRARISETTK